MPKALSLFSLDTVTDEAAMMTMGEALTKTPPIETRTGTVTIVTGITTVVTADTLAHVHAPTHHVSVISVQLIK